MLDARDVSFSVSGKALVQGISISLQPGRVHALLGPNGAGKSTLLKLLAGDLRPQSGAVQLNDRPLLDWTSRERARLRAVLPQQDSLRFAFTVNEVVALGRLACPSQTSQREAQIVREALTAADVQSLSERIYTTLSGGERARVQFARVMAQLWEPLEGELAGAPRYLLLDEPTASLDLSHQHACLKMARCFAARGIGVLAVLHDPNLAMSYSDDTSLLRDGRMLASGSPLETLTAANLEALYGLPVALHRPSPDARPIIWARP
jgi:iron complex transport system ATP-binding protein